MKSKQIYRKKSKWCKNRIEKQIERIEKKNIEKQIGKKADNCVKELDDLRLYLKSIQSEIEAEVKKEYRNVDFLKYKKSQLDKLRNKGENIEKKLYKLEDELKRQIKNIKP